MPHQPLPRHLVESFKRAYREAYGHDVPDNRAEELAWRTLDVLGPIIELHARAMRKSQADYDNLTHMPR